MQVDSQNIENRALNMGMWQNLEQKSCFPKRKTTLLLGFCL